MNKSDVFSLLESDNYLFRKIGLDSLFEEDASKYFLFFEYFFEIEEESKLNEFINAAYYNLPFLKKGFMAPVIQTKEYKFFSDLYQNYTVFIIWLNQFVNSLSDIDKVPFLRKLDFYFPSIIYGIDKKYKSFSIQKEAIADENRQLMLFITEACNLSCSYCFSKEMLSGKMDIHTIENILKWAKTNTVSKMPICGGEPTIHPDFDEILSLFSQYKMETYFASNFTIPLNRFDNYHANIVKKVFAHYTEQHQHQRKLHEQFISNILYSKEKEIEVILRVNIFDELPVWNIWWQLLDITGINQINIALTFPNNAQNNTHVSVENMKSCINSICELMEKAKLDNIALNFAKPLPVCLFPAAFQKRVLTDTNLSPLCHIHHNNYTNNVAITSDLNLIPCLGLFKYHQKFDFTQNWEQVTDLCANIVQPLLNTPLMDNCTSCFLFDTKLCQGSCLSYKVNEEKN